MPNTIQTPSAGSILRSALDTSRKMIDIAGLNLSSASDPNHSRVEVLASTTVHNGTTSGVKIAEVVRVVDEHLVGQVREQNSLVNELGVYEELYGTLSAQGFGQKGTQNSFFHHARALSDALSQLTTDPSAINKLGVVTAAQTFSTSLNKTAATIENIRGTADGSISTDVDKINSLLTKIADYNTNVRHAVVSGHDANTFKDLRQAAIHELSQYIAIQARDESADGQVSIYANTSAQEPLVIGGDYSQLSYMRSLTNVPGNTYGQITLSGIGRSGAPPMVLTNTLKEQMCSGRLKALLTMRDTLLPNLQQQLDVFAQSMRDQFNAAHNLGCAVNPASTLTGTVGIPGSGGGLTGSETIAGQGAARIGIINSTGELVAHVDIDLSSINNVNGLIAAINVGSSGVHASINSAGALVLNVPEDNPNCGIVIGTAGSGEARLTNGSSYNGANSYGISHFFGLNNLFTTGSAIAGGSNIGISNAFAVRSDIVSSNGRYLSTGTLSSSTMPANPAVGPGDVSIANLLASQLTNANVSFASTNNSSAITTSLANYASGIIDFQKTRISLNTDQKESAEYVRDALSSKAHEVSGVDVRKVFLELQKLMSNQSLIAKAYANLLQAQQTLIDTL